MEAELIAASATADKAVWFYHLMDSFPVVFGSRDMFSIPLFVDNLACLSVTNHPHNGAKVRHIALRELRIRDFHEQGKIRPFWCPGDLNVADFFSKALMKIKFELNVHRLGVTGTNTVPAPVVSTLPAYQACYVSQLGCSEPRLRPFSSDWTSPGTQRWNLFNLSHGSCVAV